MTPHKPRISVIAALARNRVIGVENRLPWRLPEDLAHFKALTLNHPILMGRKTFESLPGLLPGRRHIVITRDPAWQAEGTEVARDLASALKLANAPHIAIFGGAQVYAEALPLADRIELTEVHAAPPGDAMFPAFDPADWIESFRETHPPQGRVPGFDFVTLLRKPAA
jgi:dihydrofolate reductase